MTVYVYASAVDQQILADAGLAGSSVPLGGAVPAGAVYVGIAGRSAPAGAQTLEGATRVETRQMVNTAAQNGGPTNGTVIDGKQVLSNLFDFYGIHGIDLNAAYQQYVASGQSDDYMLNSWLPTQPAFQAMYPAYQPLAQSGHGITLADYQNYNHAIAGLASQFGVPDGFFTPTVIANMLLAHKDPTEISSELQDYAVALAHPDVQKRLVDQGLDPAHMTPGDLAAYFTDAKTAQPLLEQKFLAAQLGAASDRAGVSISAGEATKLAGQDVTVSQGTQGFGQLAASAPLLAPLPGSGESTISTDTAADALVGGDAKAGAVLKQRQDSRLAPFQGGGGFANTSTGTGIGSARSA